MQLLCRGLFGCLRVVFFFFTQKTAYELRISDWSSDVCSSDLHPPLFHGMMLIMMEFRTISIHVLPLEKHTTNSKMTTVVLIYPLQQKRQLQTLDRKSVV